DLGALSGVEGRAARPDRGAPLRVTEEPRDAHAELGEDVAAVDLVLDSEDAAGDSRSIDVDLLDARAHDPDQLAVGVQVIADLLLDLRPDVIGREDLDREVGGIREERL